MAKQHYILGKRIARGGMAEIFLGKAVGEAAFQRLCAIKRILPHYNRDAEFVEMFRDEAHICKRLQHANIVQVYDFTDVEGSFALIMEYVEGADLRTLLSSCEASKSRLSIPMALYIAANTARGLHYAHTKTDEMTGSPLGIVHRDISPQNIMISYEGDVKIADFGIASAETKATETRPGVIKGKYSYMSPEQIAAKQLDSRSDIFSLSIVLWECLAMKRLFAGVTEVESIRRVQNCEIPLDLREINPEVNNELYQIVMRGLSADRKDRYQSAAAMEKQIRRFLHSHYSDFTASELGDFLKRILAKRRDRSQKDIKETLSLVENNTNNAERGQVFSEQLLHQQQELQEQEPAPEIEQKAEESHPLELSMEHAEKSRPLQLKRSEMGTRFGRSQISTAQNTMQNIPMNVSVHKRSPISRKPQGSRKKPWLSSLFLGVILLGVGFYLVADYLFDSHFHIKIATVPSRVEVKINNRTYKNGFIATPSKISVQPGQYRIEISRPGYVSEFLQVAGRKRETKTIPKIFLKRVPGSTLVDVEIIAQNFNVTANVNDGLYAGNLPMKVELRPLVKHTLFFIPEHSRSKKPLRCYFTPAASLGLRQKLVIEQERNGAFRCSMRN